MHIAVPVTAGKDRYLLQLIYLRAMKIAIFVNPRIKAITDVKVLFRSGNPWGVTLGLFVLLR